MKKRPAKKAAKPVVAKSADYDVIRACVLVASNLAAYRAAIAADPSGNSDYVNEDTHFYRRALKALAVAAAPVITEQGLDAKARIIKAVLDDNADFELTEEAFAFVVSFAADVKAHYERLENLRCIEANAAF